MGGGAWPFLVGGVICLVNSDNERDLSLLNSGCESSTWVKRWMSVWVASGCSRLWSWILDDSLSHVLLRGTIRV